MIWILVITVAYWDAFPGITPASLRRSCTCRLKKRGAKSSKIRSFSVLKAAMDTTFCDLRISFVSTENMMSEILATGNPRISPTVHCRANTSIAPFGDGGLRSPGSIRTRHGLTIIQIPGLVNIEKTNWKDPPCYAMRTVSWVYTYIYINYFDWAMASIAFCQRLPGRVCAALSWTMISGCFSWDMVLQHVTTFKRDNLWRNHATSDNTDGPFEPPQSTPPKISVVFCRFTAANKPRQALVAKWLPGNPGYNPIPQP